MKSIKSRMAMWVAITVLSSLTLQASDSSVIPVELVTKDGASTLLRGGQPYEIKGAGLEFSDIGVFASHGGNSIRTWRTVDAGDILDQALANGVTVLLCIEIGRERHGFDYDDEKAVAAQLEFARGEVKKYKDHPALLGWMIGNEPNLFFKNPKVFDAINDISQMIHEIDEYHPTTTALAGFNADLAKLIEQRSSDLDFVSIQMYGDIVNLPKYIEEIGFTGPYLVTEWGAIGHWEVPKTAWGVPIEQNSSDKADNYLKSHRIAIASNPNQVIGSYVFLWGQKQERTPTWYGMFLQDGTETETIDAMHYIWTGDWPKNRSPRIGILLLDSKNANQDVTLEAGKPYEAIVPASDPDGDTLRYHWEIMRESQATQDGGDREVVPEVLTGLVDATQPGGVVVTAPNQAGAYRLFVYVYDGQGHAGHANIPFFVN